MMPTIDIQKIEASPEERKVLQEVVKKNGQLYASKPKKASGRGKYLWRELVFYLSSNPKHQCMPVTNAYELNDEDWENRTEVTKQLHSLADKVLKTVRPEKRHGLRRWAKIL